MDINSPVRVIRDESPVDELDARIVYWEGLITLHRKDLSRMLDEKRKQDEGDVAGTSITPRATEQVRAKVNSSTRSNITGPRGGASGIEGSRPRSTTSGSRSSTVQKDRSRSTKRDYMVQNSTRPNNTGSQEENYPGPDQDQNRNTRSTATPPAGIVARAGQGQVARPKGQNRDSWGRKKGSGYEEERMGESNTHAGHNF